MGINGCRLDELHEKFDNVSGFDKEIDHTLDRIAIEKHQGIALNC